MDVVKLWDICLSFEYDKEKLLAGLDTFLQPFKDKKILDCACGTGFVTLDLIHKGYDITCTDGSEAMLTQFKKNAHTLDLTTTPLLLKWSELKEHFSNTFDVIICRGSSLIYGAAWDNCSTNSQSIIEDALQNFFSCLKSGGMLYIDTTSEENLTLTEPQQVTYPAKQIDGVLVELHDKVTTDKEKQLRIWEPTVYCDGVKQTLKRYSYYLPHENLISLLKQNGFHSIQKQQISGEHYAVFTGQK